MPKGRESEGGDRESGTLCGGMLDYPVAMKGHGAQQGSVAGIGTNRSLAHLDLGDTVAALQPCRFGMWQN